MNENAPINLFCLASLPAEACAIASNALRLHIKSNNSLTRDAVENKNYIALGARTRTRDRSRSCFAARRQDAHVKASRPGFRKRLTSCTANGTAHTTQVKVGARSHDSSPEEAELFLFRLTPFPSTEGARCLSQSRVMTEAACKSKPLPLPSTLSLRRTNE